jgi:hypothetical protein
MTPRTIKIGAWLFIVAMLIDNVVIPGGSLALNALHPQSRGESPLLSVMAMGVGFVFVVPRLLLGGVAIFNIVRGRNWARVVALILISASFYSAFQSLSPALMLNGVSALPFWFLYQGIVPALYLASAFFLVSKNANTWFRDQGGESTEVASDRSGGMARQGAQNAPARPGVKKLPSVQAASPVITVKIAVFVLGMELLIRTITEIAQLASAPNSNVNDPSVAWLNPLAATFELGIVLIVVVPQIFLIYMTYRRRLWAASLLILLIGIGSAFYLRALITKGLGASISSYADLALTSAAVFGAILLLVPQSIHWFRNSASSTRA